MKDISTESIRSNFERVYSRISNLEVELKDLSKALNANPSILIYKQLKAKIIHAEKTLDPKSLSNSIQAIVEYYRAFNIADAYPSTSRDSVSVFATAFSDVMQYVANCQSVFFQRVNESRDAIYEMEEKAEEGAFLFQNVSTSETAGIPNISSFVSLTVFQLDKALRYSGYDDAVIKKLLR